MTSQVNSLNQENFTHSYFSWRDRQAGVSMVFDSETELYTYNAYCVEISLIKELFSCEYEYLDDAIDVINQEFGNWDLQSFDKKGCSSCVAKK